MWNNWHDCRTGTGFDWSHQHGRERRARDVIEFFARFATALPTTHAAPAARVAAICVGGVCTVNPAIAPPWR